MFSSLLLLTSATTVAPHILVVSKASAAEKRKNVSNGSGGVTIIKPPLDNRIYEANVLSNNGL